MVIVLNNDVLDIAIVGKGVGFEDQMCITLQKFVAQLVF